GLGELAGAQDGRRPRHRPGALRAGHRFRVRVREHLLPAQVPGDAVHRAGPVDRGAGRRRAERPAVRDGGTMSDGTDAAPKPGIEAPDKVLITGGAGFIGSTVASACLDAGLTPVVLDNLSTGRREFTEGRIFYEGDIADPALLDKIFTEH